MRLPRLSLRLHPAALALPLLLAGCAIGPDYERPATPMSAQFKQLDGWRLAEPAEVMRDDQWWARYQDGTLSALVRDIDVSNQNLAQAEARYRQALALSDGARAGFFPTLGASASASRSGSSGNGGNGGGQGSGSNAGTRYEAGLTASWLPDIWGRVRREVEAGRATAQASAADLAAARLSAQSSLALAYFQLRVLDQQAVLLSQTVQAYERSFTLTRNQYEAGLTARADVVQAETQLEQVRVQLRDLDWQRAQQENAIAVLVGRVPSDFSLPRVDGLPRLPAIPQALPSTLLQRRPDISSAERTVAAANARIGVAEAAWFPDLTLSASGSLQHNNFADWISAPYRVWSLGPALALSLFDGGARSAALAQATASYDEQVARYRQTVLDGLRETEDALALLRTMEAEIVQQRRVVALAEENETLVTNRYREGIVTFLEVAVAQNTTLTARRTLLQLQGTQLQASVQLMTALGGGWDGDLAPETGPLSPRRTTPD
ncbi:RND efflux system, outer membrane lipoprotein, NodT family [plant metagenome]|uniref:RND efflux system, outer membrane lipoprotein, NodT family n=1 Tax=plant metagenome TaxID=1297885 RepID=A0A484P339_9ZZZZ